MCIGEREREIGGCNKSRTGTDCRVRGGRDGEVERIPERERGERQSPDGEVGI